MSLTQGGGGAGGSPPGSDTQVPFNDGGAFGADAGFTYNKTSDFCTLAGGVALGSSPATSGTIRVGGSGVIGQMKWLYSGVDRNIVQTDSSVPEIKYGDSNIWASVFGSALTLWTASSMFLYGTGGVQFARLGGTSSDYLSLGAGPYPTTGTIRGVDGFAIKCIQSSVDRPIISYNGGAIQVGDFTGINTILYRVANAGGEHYFQINNANYLWVTTSTIRTGAPVGGLDVSAVPFRWRSATATLAGSDLTLSAAEYVCPVVKIAGTTGDVIAPHLADSFFFARNITDSFHGWKRSGGIAVKIPPRKAAVLLHDGVDYIRLCSDPVGTQGLRLTLTSNTPVPPADVATGPTIYLTPYESGTIALIDSGSLLWINVDTDEIGLSLSGLTASKNYDVFAYINSLGAVSLELIAWTNNTTRATALFRLNGVLVKSGDYAKRYIGTIRTISTTQSCDTLTKRYVWNYYHRRPHRLRIEASSSWTYSSSTWRQANNNAAFIAEFVCGDVVEVEGSINCLASQATSNGHAGVGIGIDSITVDSAGSCSELVGVGAFCGLYARLEPTRVAAGYHYVSWLEHSENATTTFYGEANAGAGTKLRDAAMQVLLAG
jgi:hypothetical protein